MSDITNEIWSPKPRSFNSGEFEKATAVIMAVLDCHAKIARKIACLARRLAPFGEWCVEPGRLYTSKIEIEIVCRHEPALDREEFAFAYQYDRTWGVMGIGRV